MTELKLLKKRATREHALHESDALPRGSEGLPLKVKPLLQEFQGPLVCH